MLKAQTCHFKQITKKCNTRSKIKISSNTINSIYDALRLYSVPELPPLINKLFQNALGLYGKASKLLCLARHIVGKLCAYHVHKSFDEMSYNLKGTK